MGKFLLGEQQQEALDAMTDFLESDEMAFSLSGYAGTGKTYLVKALIDYLEDVEMAYELCVPTHKAKTVLESFTERKGVTLHKLLSLSPHLEIFKLDFNYLKFLVKDNNMLFPVEGVVICDESSMVNDELFDLLLEQGAGHHTKIIFIGDKAQLKPVNSKGYSKVFDVKNNYTLTKIYRQKEESGLVTVLPTLRTQSIYRFQQAVGTEGSLYCHDNVKDLIVNSIPYFKKAIKGKDIMEAKFLAYTNRRVDAFNNKIEEILFDKESEYNIGGFLTAYDNIEFNTYNFYNSMDYVVTEIAATNIIIPGFCPLPGYKLRLYDSSCGDTGSVSILSKTIDPDFLRSLAMYIDQIREQAVTLKQQKNFYAAKLRWRSYYKILGSFTTPVDLYYEDRLIRRKSFDRGYAVTVHKSQGSSINNIFIDMKDIAQRSNRQELRQLQYVAMSRANTNAYILQ